MSLMQSKKPEGLIDGCFGKSSYCTKCGLEKELFEINEYMCLSCRWKADFASQSDIDKWAMEIECIYKNVPKLKDKNDILSKNNTNNK